MSEELKNVETPGEVQKEQETPKHTDVELKAMDMGWRPKDEWDGDPEAFVEAKEYVARQPLFDKIQSQNKLLKETQRALEAFKVHYTKVEETALNKALAKLKAQKDAAAVDGDMQTYRDLDKEIESVTEQVDQVKQLAQTPLVQEQPAEHPAFISWKRRNAWYTEQGYMKAFADEVGVKLANQGMDREEILAEVEKRVKKEFPHKFRNPNKESAPDVDSSRKNTGITLKDIEADLTPQERNIMNTLVRSGEITKEKYLTDLKEYKTKK